LNAGKRAVDGHSSTPALPTSKRALPSPPPVFRSTVDVWGISQVFPVMPIHRWVVRLTNSACDCWADSV